MVTQYEDVANQVAQEKIGNQRLRNEAIRKGMQDPWSAPEEATSQTPSGTTPSSLMDVSKGTGTLANTYSNLLNNAKVLNLTSNSGNSPSETTSNTSMGKMPGYVPALAGKGMSLISGNGLYGALTNMALTGLSGNWKGAAAQGAGTLTSMFSKTPGLGGIVGSLTSGLLGEKSKEQIGMDMGNTLLGTGLSLANPALGSLYGLARLFGFDPAQGISESINYTGTPGYQGGYWGKPGMGSGITDKSGSSYTTQNNYTSPAGFSSGDLGSGISNNGSSGLSGGIPSNYSW